MVHVAGFAGCYFIAALGSQILLHSGDAVSPAFSPVGLLLGILLRSRRSTWPVWLAISLAALVMAHALVGRPVGAALAISVGDAVGAAAGALLVQRFCGRPFRLDSLRSLANLISLAAVAAPLGAAMVAAGYIHLAIGHPFGLLYASGWTSMFASIVLVTPAVLLWRRDWPTGWIRAARGLEFGGLATGAVLLPILAFWLSEGPLLPLVMLPLLWAAIRFGPFEAAAANLILGVVAAAAAVSGAGAAFGQLSGPVETMFHTQAFLALMAIGPSLTVAFTLAAARAAGTARESGDARLQALLDYSPMAIAVRDFDGRYLTVNRRFCEWYGDVDTAGGRTTIHDVFAKPVADEMAAFARRIIAERQPIQHEFEVVLRDGEQHRISVVSFPILDHAGVVTAIGGIGFDVTEARRAEDQLRQAQKMEAVGQLTGGLAHDFNNLLAVILGNLELLLETLPEQGKSRARTHSALRAAERGAALTHRLLAFSRKQALKPVALDLNQVIRSMRSLLQQSLGKQVTVEIVAAAGLWRCEADPVQVESALLNLANNARDAMPAGGKLTIGTGNVRLDGEQAADLGDVGPGEYVMIAVADTGEGMSEEVRRRAFDPFFTTKEQGKGSGLGLAMVHGFVKQSGGHVGVQSAPGEGTTVSIYLPRSQVADGDSGRPDRADEQPMGRRERVLVVEDDPDLRSLTVELLTDLGYEPLEARDGPSALALTQRVDRIDLLLTDVVLSGGMSGRELAKGLCAASPSLRVLYMSGYTADAVGLHGRLDVDVELLHKPFRKVDLARAVRRVLDAVP